MSARQAGDSLCVGRDRPGASYYVYGGERRVAVQQFQVAVSCSTPAASGLAEEKRLTEDKRLQNDH